MGSGRRRNDAGRLRAAGYARTRREQLGLTQSDVASAAGLRDVKTIRNMETGRNWPNDLTRRGIEMALSIESGALDRIGAVGDTGEIEQYSDVASVGGQGAVPSAQELIDLSSAVNRLSVAREAMLRRGDDHSAERVRGLIDAISAVMAGLAPAIEGAATEVADDYRPSRQPNVN